jgi:hypothetical protein
MEFTLHYRGPLKAASQRNKRKDHKHGLRRHFHKQLKELWNLLQLSQFRSSLVIPDLTTLESRTLLRRVAQYHFAPLIGSYLELVASQLCTISRVRTSLGPLIALELLLQSLTQNYKELQRGGGLLWPPSRLRSGRCVELSVVV